MAVINLLIVSNNKFNWGKIHNEMKSLNFNELEYFPVPEYLGFKSDAVGVYILYSESNFKSIYEELTICYEYFKKMDCKVYELYNNDEIHSSDMLYKLTTNFLS